MIKAMHGLSGTGPSCMRRWLLLTSICCIASVEAPVSHAAPKVADNSITLNFNGKEEKLRLINGKIQLNAVKDAFNLQTVQLDGQLEPADQLGFTVAEYKPGQTILVSGSPVAGERGSCRSCSVRRCCLLGLNQPVQFSSVAVGGLFGWHST